MISSSAQRTAYSLFSVALLAAVLHPTAVFAWGTKNTHWQLADEAVDQFNSSQGSSSRIFSNFLQRELDLPKGLDEPLAVQLGFDPSIDAEIGPIENSRLNRSRSLYPDKYGPAPIPAHIEINHSCTASSDPACASNLKRYPVSKLIRAGAWAEDNPNPRARHHFHDPSFEHPPPPENHGLNDQKPVPGLNLFTELITWIARGGDASRFLASFKKYNPFSPEIDPDFGNFEYRGRSALDRALNLPLGAAPLPSTRSPENLFALPDAERYLYLGLTVPQEDEREHYLALHFIAFAHVLHLLQDMSSPGHVRNDFMMEHLLRGTASFEGVGDRYRVAASVLGRVGINNLFEAWPEDFLSGQGINDPRYLQSLAGFELNATGLDIADFWDQGNPGVASGAGLAEVVQRHVFSTGSIGGAPGDPSEYPFPKLPHSCAETDSAGSGDSLVFVAELPVRSLETGLVVNPGKTQRFLSSPLIPHLGRCRFHAEYLGTDTLFGVTLVDESVQRDYLEVLWPFTIDYTAKLMEHYYRPRLVVLPESYDSFKLANPTRLEFEADVDSVEIVYDGIDGRRHSALASCSGVGEFHLPAAEPPGTIGEKSELTWTMPALNTLPVLPARDDFWIVVRGALGSRGGSGSGEEYDQGSKEYVVAFTHVRPEIFFDQIIGAPISDGSQEVDIYSIWVDLDQEILAGASGGQEPQNRTAAFRDSLGAPLDFAEPEQDPSTPGRLVIRHDLGAPSNQQYPLFVAGTLMSLGLLELAPDSPTGVVMTTVPDSETDFLSWMREGARWSPDGRFLFANRVNPSNGEWEYTRFDLNTNEAVALVLPDIFSVVEEDSDTITAETCNQLRSVTPLSATEVAMTVKCYRQVLHKPLMNLSHVPRSAESIFLATLTPDGEDLSIDVTDVIDMSSGTSSFASCPLAENPTKPEGSPQGFECPAILADSIQWGEEVFVEKNAQGQVTAAKLVFLHNVHPQHVGEPGLLTDIVIADLQSEVMRIAVKDIVAKTEPTQGGGTINIAPRPAHWSPSGGMLAFYDPRTDQIEVAPVADMSALPVDPIPIAWVPNIARTLTWGIPLRFPSGN